MTGTQCCGACMHHRYDQGAKDWYCDNLNSDNYADYTGYEDGWQCEEFERRKPASISEKLEKSMPFQRRF